MGSSRFVIVWVFACLFAHLACSSSSATAGRVADGGTGPATLGAAGGSVASADGTARVSIPAGALATTATITVTETTGTVSPASATVVGEAFTFGPEGQQFAAPATVTLTFDPAKLPSGQTSSGIVIQTAPAGSSTFTSLATTVVDATHVSAKTSHFSNFVPTFPIVGPACDTNADCSGTAICLSGVCTSP
jgi:hypothetical protein